MKLYPPVLTAIAALSMAALDHWAPLARMVPRNPWGAAAVAAGVMLVLWSAWTLRRRGTTLDPHGTPSALVISGPFRFSRNPIYLGLALVLAGLAASLGSSAPWGVMAAWVFALNHLFITREEAALVQVFGDDFTTYSLKVRRWF